MWSLRGFQREGVGGSRGPTRNTSAASRVAKESRRFVTGFRMVIVHQRAVPTIRRAVITARNSMRGPSHPKIKLLRSEVHISIDRAL